MDSRIRGKDSTSDLHLKQIIYCDNFAHKFGPKFYIFAPTIFVMSLPWVNGFPLGGTPPPRERQPGRLCYNHNITFRGHFGSSNIKPIIYQMMVQSEQYRNNFTRYPPQNTQNHAHTTPLSHVLTSNEENPPIDFFRKRPCTAIYRMMLSKTPAQANTKITK